MYLLIYLNRLRDLYTEHINNSYNSILKVISMTSSLNVESLVSSGVFQGQDVFPEGEEEYSLEQVLISSQFHTCCCPSLKPPWSEGVWWRWWHLRLLQFSIPTSPPGSPVSTRGCPATVVSPGAPTLHDGPTLSGIGAFLLCPLIHLEGRVLPLWGPAQGQRLFLTFLKAQCTCVWVSCHFSYICE